MNPLIKKYYEAALKRSVKKTFPVWQKLGFHVSLNHFYEPVPDTSTLKEELWTGLSELPGIDINDGGQQELLESFMKDFKSEYDRFPESVAGAREPYQYYFDNNSFSSVDGELLYCMIRSFKPRRVIEVGSGFSTFIAAAAILKNREDDPGYDCSLSSIDPYPNNTVTQGFPGFSGVDHRQVQDVPVSTFSELGDNDILFIDSSHVLKIGSDVHYEFLEILPRLNRGVIVHVHDIFTPAEYPRKWVMKQKVFWNEQYLLQAFLAFNDSFEVLFGAAYMNYRWPDKLAQAFGSYKKGFSRPGSFWIRKTR